MSVPDVPESDSKVEAFTPQMPPPPPPPPMPGSKLAQLLFHLRGCNASPDDIERGSYYDTHTHTHMLLLMLYLLPWCLV